MLDISNGIYLSGNELKIILTSLPNLEYFDASYSTVFNIDLLDVKKDLNNMKTLFLNTCVSLDGKESS